ncbi:hypothetical protein I3843_13G094000 [Carya illinoinensis]|nr:hypothetical protein I3843_13G094000 [Carya illinoinensis]
MDLVASCKDKLAYFRIKELKDVLTQLGLSKQGKKQDLVDRILALLSDEQVSKMWPKKNGVGKELAAKLVDDIFRKMQVSGATDLASNGQGVSDSSNVKVKGEIDNQFQLDTKIRCLCGNSLESESMIKCEDPRCHVWQHISCVIIMEKPTEGNPQVPDLFYCELCRLSRADPFWVTVANPLYPVKWTNTKIPTDGTNPVQSLEKTFQLTRAEKDLLAKQEYDVQWPQYVDLHLQVNGMPVRAINRPGSQLLGANGRDDGPIITPYTKDGINKISLTGCDARIFCFGVRIVKRQTVHQILSMIPKESEGERFEDALARVCRIGGGTATDNADSDSDVEVVADYFGVNLRCPMRYCGEDVAEIEVKPDGSWRVKTKNESERRDMGDLAQWHFPDGTICVPDAQVRPRVEVLKEIKHEGISEGHTGLKLGIRKNSNGLWEFSKPEDMNTSSENGLQERFANYEQKVIPMSSSATGSGRDGEDQSVNQDGGGNFDFSTQNGIEMESISLNVDSAYGFAGHNPSAPIGSADVIVLSDSDGEDDVIVSSGTVYKNNPTDAGGVNFSVPPSGIGETYPEDPTLGVGSSCLDIFNDDEFGMPLWPLPPGTQAGPGFQLFSSDVDVPDGLVGLQHGSMNCSSSMNGYTLAPETDMGSAPLLSDPSIGRSDTDIIDGLVDNPLAFAGDDPSLQIFLPTRPSDAAVQTDMRDRVDVSNGVRTEDWISLSLGGGATGSNGESAAPNGLNSRELPSREGALDSLADTASLLLGMNDSRSDMSSRQRSDSPFSFPSSKTFCKAAIVPLY